jgi:transcriptional regulator with XRE-family HTH domain
MFQLRGGMSNAEPASAGITFQFHIIDTVQSVCKNLVRIIENVKCHPRPWIPNDTPRKGIPERQALVMATVVSKILDHLKDGGGLQGKDIANIVAVSPATVSRWSSGKATPDLKTQMIIAELRYVVDRLADFYTPDETRLWLHARHPILHNARAIDLINAGRTEEVLAVIEALDAAAYT